MGLAGRGGRVGRGDGPKLLWIHGYTLDSSAWDELWPLIPGYMHVGVDLPGHGGSAGIEPGSTLIDLGKRLSALCEEQKIDHVVALSFGTIVALQLLMERNLKESATT